MPKEKVLSQEPVEQKTELESLKEIIKEQESVIENFKTGLKERDGIKCCVAIEPRYNNSFEDKRKYMYRSLNIEKDFYAHLIKELKHRIIEGNDVDLCKAELRDAKKNFKRIKKIIKRTLK